MQMRITTAKQSESASIEKFNISSNRQKWILLKLLLVVLLIFHLASVVSNVTISFLLQNGEVPALFLSSNTSSPAKSHTAELPNLSSNGFEIHRSSIDVQFVHSLINGTNYCGVDRYTNYTLWVLKRHNKSKKSLRWDEKVNDVTSFHYPIDIGPCKTVNGSLKKSLFVGVVSAPSNFQRRRNIRRTWLRHLRDERIVQPQSNNSVNIIGFGFVLGQTKDAYVQAQIEKESRAHGDVLQVQMMDDYYDLAVKGVAFFNWLNDNCPDVDFVLKVDDDVYVNVRNMTSVVAALPFPSFPAPVSVYGFNDTVAFPKRGGLTHLIPFKQFQFLKNLGLHLFLNN